VGPSVRKLRAYVKTNPPLRTALFLAQNAWHAARSLTAEPLVPDDGTEPRHSLVAMVRVKDEARFLPEWMAHHVGLGVEHVYVYDNNSSDGVEEVIRPFVERGLATYVHWPPVPASPGAQHDALRRFGPATRWMAFFDVDEFLVESRPGELAEVLRRHADRPAVAFNSRYFGSAGHERIPRGLVTERFDRADPFVNHHVKVIARPAAVHRYRNDHNFYYRGGRLARTPGGRRVFGSFVTPPRRPEAVVHHYVYRSREDFERKARRGYSTATGQRNQVRRIERVDIEFPRHNEARVTVPAATRQATAALLRELGYPPELYESDADDAAEARRG
jgi:hypothetical protein